MKERDGAASAVARQTHSASLFTSLQAVLVRGVDMALLRGMTVADVSR